MVPGIMDRQDASVWNAIEAKNFKQALKLIDKRISKKPTAYLEALKIYVQSNALSAGHDTGDLLIQLEKLVTRTPVVTDLDAIELYGEAFHIVLPDSPEEWAKVIGEVRLLRVKALPKDEEGSLKCFQECLMHDDIDHAQQIANNLEKNFPKNHAYHLWTITTLFYYSQSPKYPEAARNMRGRLAFALISKLAAETKKAGDVKPPPVKSIHSPQELLLLHLITEIYGKPEQRLDFLKDPYLGPESAVAKGEWQLWRFKLQLLTKTEQWNELFQTASGLLKRARAKDASGQISEARYSDWIIWEALIRSANELGQAEQVSEVQGELEAHLDHNSGIDKSWRRNAALAWLTFNFDQKQCPFFLGTLAISKKPGQRPLSQFTLILDYLERYGDASTAYNDVRPFAESLTPDERSQLLYALLLNKSQKMDTQGGKDPRLTSNLNPPNQDVTTANSITKLINTYKLVYLLTSSVPEYERKSSPGFKSGNKLACIVCSEQCGLHCNTCLTKLAQATLKSYKKAICENKAITNALLPTDRHPADDLCVMAAMCLMKLSIAESDVPNVFHILQATILLEYAWIKSKPNFQITLLLIKLYSYIGCGSLAMRAYERLGLKQIQLDTLSYTMFDRISSLHPHGFTHHPDETSRLLDPIAHTMKQQGMYQTSLEQIRKQTWKCFENGSYNAALEIKEVSDKLFHSMAGVMAYIENVNMTRLLKPVAVQNASSNLFDKNDLLEINDQDVHDTNDYESYPNFECTHRPRFMSQFLVQLPQPSKCRFSINNAGTIFKSMLDLSMSPDRFPPTLLPDTEIDLAKTLTDITESERIAAICNDVMTYILSSKVGQTQELSLKGDIKKCNTFLLELLRKQLDTVQKMEDSAPTCQTDLHILYTSHELGTTVVKFSQRVSKSIKDSKLRAEWEGLKTPEAGQNLILEVMQKSFEIKRNLDEGGLIDWILEALLKEDDEEEESAIGSVLKEVVDENFMELWAGEVVESWNDSIVGFGYFGLPESMKQK